MTRLRALAAVVVAAFAVTVAVAGLAPGAEATTYRYWVYWHYTDGSWHYSGVGASGYRVPDGGVEGWRFGRGQSSSAVVTPRLGGEYEQLCPDDPANADGTQVAVVIDFGTEGDAPATPPKTYCRTLGSHHQGSDALTATRLGVRVEQGLVCAIHDYPKAPECGKTVDDPKPTSKATPKPVATAAPASTHQQPAPVARVSAVSNARPVTATSTPQPADTRAAQSAPPTTGSSTPSATDLPIATDPQDADPAVPRRTPIGLIAGAVLVLALGAAAAVKARR